MQDPKSFLQRPDLPLGFADKERRQLPRPSSHSLAYREQYKIQKKTYLHIVSADDSFLQRQQF